MGQIVARYRKIEERRPVALGMEFQVGVYAPVAAVKGEMVIRAEGQAITRIITASVLLGQQMDGLQQAHYSEAADGALGSVAFVDIERETHLVRPVPAGAKVRGCRGFGEVKRFRQFGGGGRWWKLRLREGDEKNFVLVVYVFDIAAVNGPGRGLAARPDYEDRQACPICSVSSFNLGFVVSRPFGLGVVVDSAGGCEFVVVVPASVEEGQGDALRVCRCPGFGTGNERIRDTVGGTRPAPLLRTLVSFRWR
jgi:hypothetical protein